MSYAEIADAFVGAVRVTQTAKELALLLGDVTREMDFRHFALIRHGDLQISASHRIDIKDYPAAVTERLIDKRTYRRDPVIRSCLFADSAFLWSEMHRIVVLDRLDRESLEFGLREGLNEGITVPCIRLGERMGSCTFAGISDTEAAARCLGAVQMVGVFAFQAARRIITVPPAVPAPKPKLHPRPRDCVILAGRGYSNKEIARQLALTPRTVDGYLTEARHLFDAHDRTELVVCALLAGEIELCELRKGQPE